MSVPESCPKVTAIQALGLNQAKFGGNWIATYSPSSKYGTEYEWNFVMLKDGLDEEVQNEAQALEKAQRKLATLQYYTGPIYNDEHQITVCLYQTDEQSLLGMTFNPPQNTDDDTLKKYGR